jgi:auxin responsive GH3 family protein/jasmonic acid-amino synthetase
MLEKKATRSTRVDGVSGEAVIEEFERVTRDAANVQRETLRRILAENGGVEYLRGLGLAGATDPATFRARVPLATHADLEPYIDRIADGDASPVLTAKPATSISLRSVSPPAAACCSLTSIENVADHGGDHLTAGACSSGTTQGKRKYLLFNEELVKSTMQIYRISYAFRNRYAIAAGELDRCLFRHPPRRRCPPWTACLSLSLSPFFFHTYDTY